MLGIKCAVTKIAFDCREERITGCSDRMARGKNAVEKSNRAGLGFEEKLWAAADKLRGHMDETRV
jgi:hypothetical protein